MNHTRIAQESPKTPKHRDMQNTNNVYIFSREVTKMYETLKTNRVSQLYTKYILNIFNFRFIRNFNFIIKIYYIKIEIRRRYFIHF